MWREYLSLQVNVLTNSPKIWDLNYSKFFELILFQIKVKLV